MSKLINYEISGTGTPLLFMHGLGADRRQTTGALAGIENVQLIAPDFRSHGDSIHTGEGLNFDQFTDDVIAILDKEGLDKVNVGGLSMGSGVTLNMCLRYPERVNKLIVLRPSWPDQCEPEHLKLVADAGFLIEDLGLDEGEKTLESTSAYKELIEENEKVALSINGVFKRPQAHQAATVLYKMWQDRPFDDLAKLKQIDKDALVLYTTRDELHPIAIAEAIHEQLPKSSIAELPPRYYDNAAYTDALRKVVTEFLNN